MQSPASRPSYPSDIHSIVDACIASAREAAGLDEDVEVVLPPLPLMAPRRAVTIFTKSETSDLVSLSAVSLSGPSKPVPTAPALTTGAPSPRRGRWPLALCGFVAGAFACAALLASPVGRQPGVVHATASARGHAASAVHATAVVLGAWY